MTLLRRCEAESRHPGTRPAETASHAGAGESGFTLVLVLLLSALIMSLLSGYFILGRIDLSTTRSSLDSTRGFYAAEAGVNLRSADIRNTFEGFNVPSGTSPVTAGQTPCYGANVGSGDYACVNYALQSRAVDTFVVEDPGNPVIMVIPRGEPFQNLNASEYGYQVTSAARSGPATEAMLELRLATRLVPMFQFAAFYNKDLEILPGPAMLLEGPVHSNGDLYLGAGASLGIEGQVTTAGDIYNGRKNDTSCMPGPISVPNPGALTPLPHCAGSRRLLTQPEVDPWNGMVRMGIDPLDVPPPDALDPAVGNDYWDLADLRVVLDLTGGLPGTIQARLPNGSPDVVRTPILTGCGAVGSTSGAFFNNREGTSITMLEVNVQGLLNCIQSNAGMGALDDTSQGGLVWHFTVQGPASAGINGYGVRLSGSGTLASTVAGAPPIQGLTVVTDQAVYVRGDYNAIDKRPASVLADSLNILSNAWNDGSSTSGLGSRVASDTTINAAFLAGTDVTGGAEGAAGQDSGAYNGGLENYPRFHENWTGRTLTYRGSFVSLYSPRHVDGPWIYGSPQYTAPNRNWRYDTDFNNMANLPPMSPRFVLLRQDLFVRRYDL